MASNSSDGVNFHSAAGSFRLVGWLWIGMSFVYIGGYFYVAELSSRLLQGLILASFLVLQAILVRAYVSRQSFFSQTQAVIRSAAVALAIAGLGDDAFVSTKGFFGGPGWDWNYQPLQLGYISTITVLAGLVGGTALGILRCRTLQADEAARSAARPVESRWSNYFHSAMLWLATVTIMTWLAEWFPRRFSPTQGEVLLGAAGLLLIATIPLVVPPSRKTNRPEVFLMYAGFTAAVVIASFVCLVVISIVARAQSGLLLWAGFPFTLVAIWIACLPWLLLYLWSTEFPAAAAAQPVAITRLLPHPAEWKIATLAVIGQIAALWPALLATAPSTLGIHGIGCGYNSDYPDTSIYWFWKAYKGVSSEVIVGDKKLFRLAIDHSVCFTIPNLQTPGSVQQGTLDAARLWFWLIDPEQWESERTREIRDQLAHLIGHDFSSYDELQSWWGENGDTLVWSEKDKLLEIPAVKWQVGVPRFSVVESIRQQGPKWLYNADPQSRNPDGFFGYGSFDREARLRGLKLFVDDSLEVLTGERQRRTREYLVSLTGSDFATEDEWWHALDPNRMRLDPRYETFWKATGRISELCITDRGGTNCPSGRLKILKELTGQNFDSPQQWVQWWHDNREKVELSVDGRTAVIKKQ